VADFLNPFFADPAASGIPGEAESWTWASVSGAGAWALFNTAIATQAYQLTRESFEAGFALAWDKSYANETARLTDGTLTPSDVGVIARQEDTKALYVLIDDSPVTWQLVTSDNENWVDSLLIGVIIAAIFNGASSTFDATIETFDVWGELTWIAAGSPWVSSPNYIQQNSGDGMTPPYYLGFRGWYSTALLSNEWLLDKESFEEGWDNSPMDAAISQWQPGTAPSGILRGSTLTFPLTIPMESTKFFIWDSARDAFHRIQVATGVYASATALAAELQTKWAAAIAPFPTGLQWLTWVDADGSEGLTFGCDPGLHSNEASMFGMHEDEIEEDVRGLLGFHSMGPGGTGPSRIVFQADYVSDYPVDVQPSDRILCDRWSYVDFISLFDPILTYCVLEYNQIGAIFNVFSGGPDTYLETFYLVDWFGPGVVWKTSFSPGDLTDATFVGGVGLLNYIESFENPTVNWPDNLYEE